MRTKKLFLALTAIVALAFVASHPSMASEDDSGSLWRLIIGGSSDDSEEMMELEEALPSEEKAEPKESIDKDDPRAVATHEQTAVIKVTTDEDKGKLPLHDFCLDADGNILAAVGGEPGEIRIFDPEGKYVATWNVSVMVEAIGLGPDGHVYVGGGGKLLKLDGDGKVVLEVDAPHVATLKNNAEKIREQVIKQHEQRAKMFERQVKTYEKRIERLEKKIEKREEEMEDLEALLNVAEDAEDVVKDAEDADEDAAEDAEDAAEDAEEKAEEDEADAEEREAAAKKMKSIKRELARDRRMLKAYRDGIDSMKEYTEQAGGKELTDEEIDEQVKAMIRYKQKISSVSAAGGDLFVTCGATVGYGFDVWRTDEQFENAKKIVEGLSGCCGQMDARGGPDGLYVAENGRHRVCKYDREGELAKSWGKGARKGLIGFGGCCNPKNVAFGPDGEVYTVEDTNGRIKRYSPGGKLLGLVGTAQIGRGCLDISVAVDKWGDRVYMLDTDADHIVLLKRKEAASSDEAAGG